MESIETTIKPSKADQQTAMASYDALAAVLTKLTDPNPEIEIEETAQRIKIPLSALKLLADVLKAMSQGKPFSLVPIATEVTTQKAAEMLGCSRPHLIKLLEEGVMPYNKVGKHRRIKIDDLIQYKLRLKNEQKQHLINIIKSDEELSLYDS